MSQDFFLEESGTPGSTTVSTYDDNGAYCSVDSTAG